MTEPMDPSTQGQTVAIAVKIGYPGTHITDILIGDHKVQVPNEQLRAAGALHLSIESGETTDPSAYDYGINTTCMFAGEEEFGES